MIKKPISFYINKSKEKKVDKNIKNNTNIEEEKKDDNKNNTNNMIDNPDLIFLQKIEKKLSKLSFEEKNIYLKEKINEIKEKNGNNSKLLFDVISKLISLQLTTGDLAFNKGDYNLSLEKYKECLQLNEPLPGSEWSNYPEWFSQRIIIFNSIASTYEKLNKKEQAIEYIKLSFNLEEKYKIKAEYKNKYNDIIFLAGKQLILLENYNEALKYLLKVEKNLYEEYNIEKIIKRGKIDENIDKNFIKDDPDEYIYLLNLIYKSFIKQKDYDLGEKFYQRYEEMYSILSRIKKIRYPFKGVDEDSDEEINLNEKIKENNDSFYKSKFYKKINDNLLIGKNKMIDKAEDEYAISNQNQKRYNSESKNSEKTDKKEDKSINYNKEYVNNYKELSWGKEKERKKSLKINNNSNIFNNNKIPFAKKNNKPKKVDLSMIKDNTKNNRNILIKKQLNNSLSNILEKNTNSGLKSKRYSLKLDLPPINKNSKLKKENLKSTIKEGNLYPPYDFVFKKPEKFSVSKNIQKLSDEKSESKENIIKNPSLPKIERMKTENYLKKNKSSALNTKSSLLSMKNRSSSQKIDNINRFVRLEEKLKSIEKKLSQKKDEYSKELPNNTKRKLSSNSSLKEIKVGRMPQMRKINKNKSVKQFPSIEQINKNININKKNSKKKVKKKTTKEKKNEIKEVKKLKLPSQLKKNFEDSFYDNNNNDLNNTSIISKKENEEIKSLGSFISFGNREDKRKKTRKQTKKENEKKVNMKNIPIFKPIKIELNKRSKKINNQINENQIKPQNKLNQEAKLRFKSFQDLIIQYFTKAKLLFLLNDNIDNMIKIKNKYEKVYKKYKNNNMILNKIIDNKIYTITMHIPILNLNNINEQKSDKKDKKNSSYLETQITYKRNDSIFYSKYKINLPINEENSFYNEELKEKIIDTLLNTKLNINFAWIIFLYYFENCFGTYKLDLENRAKNIVNTNDSLIDEKNIGKNIFIENDKNEEKNSFISIQKDYIYYFIKIINRNLYNITQWKNKKILVGKKLDQNETFCNLYFNILHKYINIFSDFLYLEDNLVNKKISIRNLEIESIKNRNKIILDSLQNILKYSKDFKQLSQRILLKKLIYNSFINTDLASITRNGNIYNNDNNIMEGKNKKENIYIKKENQQLPLLDTINIIQKYKNIDIEQYFYDNQIIYKGIIKMEKYDYMHLTLSVRQFEKIILNKIKFKIVDYNVLDLKSKNTNIDFENLKFLSTDPDIIKLYPKLNIDFTQKFYETTKYKTFLQLTLVNLNANSKWYDITYIPWEIYNYFISLFTEENNDKYLLANLFSMEEISKTQKLNSEMGVLFYYFISNFCTIENGSLSIKKNLYNKDLYWKYFMKLYTIYDNYLFGLMYSQNYINKNFVEISMDVKNFYKIFLAKMHNYYYKIYFKENKYYIPEKIENNKDSDDEEINNELNNKTEKTTKKKKTKISKDNQDKNIKNKGINLYIVKKGYKVNYKSLFEKEEGNISLSFNLYLKLGKNKYNAIFKFLKNRIHITNDPENIKNYLLPTDYLPKVFIQLRSILSNELIHTNIYNIDLINNIKYMFDNNTNEKLLKTYFENLIHIANLPYGKKIIFDFLFNTFSLKSKTKNSFNDNNLSILNKISIILLHESNYYSSQIPENIILVKTYKTIYINTQKQSKILFNFRIYGDGQKVHRKVNKENKNVKESMYNKIFGKIKKSKLSEKLEIKYPNEDNDIENFKILYYYYIIGIYFPKTSMKSVFILSTYDLQVILKKIKNKNIRAQYFLSVDNFIKLLPSKISLQSTEVGKKPYIYFSKYKDLRTDWEKQLPMKNKANKLLFEKKLNYIIDKKSELKIFLKPNFVNLRSKDSLYDITTDEMILSIQKVKIYEIDNKKLSCIVTIYYHRILDYWQIFLFFPFSSRKFTTILEPKHMENIITNEILSQINKKEIKDREIFEYIINESKIAYNFEEIAYFQILNMRLLLKEILYYGYELINDGLQEGLNKIIYVEITIKSLNLFTLDKIEKVIKKVEIDRCYLIFQTFSFHELYWHKENFKLQDLEPYYSNKIIFEKKIMKNNQNQSKNQNKIVENAVVGDKKLLPYCYLRNLIIHIIQPYVNSQKHIFEKQMKLFKNKNIIGGNLQSLIDNTRYDKANQQKIANIYQHKLDNKIIFNRIYTETIRQDPPVLASVGINLVKERIFITLYYPFASKSYDIEIDFETVKKSFFPYFLDILSIDKISLGKRILRRYQNFITKTPHFLKLFQSSNN